MGTVTWDDCDKWTVRFIEMACLVASWSKDPSTQVGCVITNSANQVLSVGYNGFAREVSDGRNLYEDRKTKYARVIHAELNAILNANCDLKDSFAFVTHHPCSHCAAVLIQSGVQHVITFVPEGGIAERFKDSFEEAKIMFGEADVWLTEIDTRL